jgi:hypothetical protein
LQQFTDSVSATPTSVNVRTATSQTRGPSLSTPVLHLLIERALLQAPLPLNRGHSLSTPAPDALDEHAPSVAPSAPSALGRGSAIPQPIVIPPQERTAFKLATQLRNFQGCTLEDHQRASDEHATHHRRPDVHSECSSLQQITSLLCGDYPNGAPMPNVLSSDKLLRRRDYDGASYQAAFEGVSAAASPQDVGTRNEGLPRNLCLSEHHTASSKNRRPHVTFDIDSTCCFPTSLAFARGGINWLPKAHPILNLTADIHFGLPVPTYNAHGVLTQKYTPLYKIPHYCFGTVIGMDSLSILVFFPALRINSELEHTTYLTKQDEQLWYDAILAPSLNQIVASSNLMQHYPATANIVALDALAISAEGLKQKSSAREQLVKHTIQPQYLDRLWNRILQTIDENPGYDRFRGATLFAYAKNTKLEFIEDSLTETYDRWWAKWSAATDLQFYNKDRTFVDLGKQVTSEDSGLPYDNTPEDHEAEVFLWRRCCLEAYAKGRTVLNADGSVTKGSPKCTVYPWATMRDTVGQTLFATPQGQESRDGLIYSQFYALIKTPFDSSKVYVFNNESLENLALDPGYVRSLQQEGAAVSFSRAVCEFAYISSKKRAYANLVDNRGKSYGIREEHRILVTMLEEVYQQWHQWDLYDAEDEVRPAHLPYYITPTKDLLNFLSAQINKHCFLFEHVLAHTARSYSLPETIVMVVALRALRFCYGSSLIQRESLLYKDHWEQPRGQNLVVKEGLGMQGTMERCGLGWFIPKFNWATWRFAPPHGNNILVGNMLMHNEYKRRWRAVKDLRDVFVRFNQADSWFNRYNVLQTPTLRQRWLEYLHALTLEQFDADIWKAMLKSNKRFSELTPETVRGQVPLRFSHDGMQVMFSVDGVQCPQNFVTGNKMRFETAGEVVKFLFERTDQKRTGWDNTPFRVIAHKCYDLIAERLLPWRADRWFCQLLNLVRLTHWVLPYPSDTALLMTTKTSRSKGQNGRMMWFSAIYIGHDLVGVPRQTHPLTLRRLVGHARLSLLGDVRGRSMFSTAQLFRACKDCEILFPDDPAARGDHWVVGRASEGLKGFSPLWEQGYPPRLEMLEWIKTASLDELEDLMARLSREAAEVDNRGEAIDGYRSEAGGNDQGDGDGEGDALSRTFSEGSRQSGADSAGQSQRQGSGGQVSALMASSTLSATVSSGSVYEPSI